MPQSRMHMRCTCMSTSTFLTRFSYALNSVLWLRLFGAACSGGIQNRSISLLCLSSGAFGGRLQINTSCNCCLLQADGLQLEYAVVQGTYFSFPASISRDPW